MKELKHSGGKTNFVIVGILNDENSMRFTETALIQTQEERAMMLLASRYVDSIVFNAPLNLSEQTLKILKADEVVCVKQEVDKNPEIFDQIKRFTNFRAIYVENYSSVEKILKRVKGFASLIDKKVEKRLQDDPSLY